MSQQAEWRDAERDWHDDRHGRDREKVGLGATEVHCGGEDAEQERGPKRYGHPAKHASILWAAAD